MSMCVHLVDLVDDCPECMEIFKLRRKVETLQNELNEARRELKLAKSEQKRRANTVQEAEQ